MIVEGNKIPNPPDYTTSVGVQYSRVFGQARVSGRADAVFYGSLQYNDQNSMSQDAYSLVNLRLGVTGRFLIGELVMRNAFDTDYIPVAFPYPNFAPSGFVGEMGAPRTISVRAGVKFQSAVRGSRSGPTQEFKSFPMRSSLLIS